MATATAVRRGRRRADGVAAAEDAAASQAPQRSRLPIEQQLHRGQDIIVQIAKEPMGTKGARLTSSISLPGRHLVFTPTSNHIGVSRRIESAEERARLRADVGELRPPQGGFIVRTACEGVSRREIQRDVAFLTKLWASILRKHESMPPASILYSDLDVALRVVRDLFSSEVDRLWCDDPTTYSRVVQFVQNYMPRLRARVTLHDGPQPLFDHFNIEPQIERALDRKVWLKSGGYLIFDQAEALTAIDVNTGRFVGKRSQDDTILKTNLEAVEEVVKHLRLRNIGGIIIVDFIDMAREADRKKVSDALAAALKRDKARTSALKISELGLVQMTRKRTRESLEKLLTEHVRAMRRAAGGEVGADAGGGSAARDSARGGLEIGGRHADRQAESRSGALPVRSRREGSRDARAAAGDEDRAALERHDRSGRIRARARAGSGLVPISQDDRLKDAGRSHRCVREPSVVCERVANPAGE